MDKRLLYIVDQSTDESEMLIHSLQRRFKTEVAHGRSAAIKRIQESVYDVVVLDFYMLGGLKLLNEITAYHPQQRVITLSGAIWCSEVKGCEYCTKHHQRKRVVKPFLFSELVRAINGFDTFTCQYHNQCEPIVPQNHPRLFS